MTVLDAFRTALEALHANPLRTLLTMLGVIIGVAAVIVMVAIGAGARAQVLAQIDSIGSNLILVGQGSVTRGGVRLGAGSAATLVEDDGEALEREIPAIRMAAPSVRTGVQVVAGSQNWSSTLIGVTPAYLEAREWRLQAGRGLTGADVAVADKVVVLGDTVVRNVFGGGDPVGLSVRIGTVPFRVIGTLAPKGQSPFGNDLDDIIMAPLTTAKRSVPGIKLALPGAVGMLTVKIHDGEDRTEAQRQIKSLLRQRHRLRDGDDDDFWLRDMTEAAETRDASARALSLLLAAVAAVSLLVGGIGIMNIMLVSVTERTREIGLRLAVGARRRDILTQFLIEAITLSVLGGAVGVLAGAGTAAAVARAAGWPTLVQPAAVILAVGVSGVIGVFFGYWPARRAARLDPIEALRHE